MYLKSLMPDFFLFKSVFRTLKLKTSVDVLLIVFWGQVLNIIIVKQKIC